MPSLSTIQRSRASIASCSTRWTAAVTLMLASTCKHSCSSFYGPHSCNGIAEPSLAFTKLCAHAEDRQSIITSNERSTQAQGSKGTVEDVLRPGKEMVAAGYCMYGSSANLVISTGNGVNGYTLDSVCGEEPYMLTGLMLADRGSENSF